MRTPGESLGNGTVPETDVDDEMQRVGSRAQAGTLDGSRRRSRVAQAEVCKTLYAGSIPAAASNRGRRYFDRRLEGEHLRSQRLLAAQT